MTALTSPTGEPTKAIYLFFKILFNLINTHQPDLLAVAMDSRRDRLVRRALYPQYKANREATEGDVSDLVGQIKRVHAILRAMRVVTLSQEGSEADDIIATLVDACADLDVDITIVSRDKDLHQLLGPRVRMYDPMEAEYFSASDAEDKWGVAVEKLSALFALCGDSSDNIPGVPGIGPKRAAGLVKRYGSLAAIKEAVLDGELSPHACAGFEKVDVDLNHQLVSLARNVQIPAFDIDALDVKNISVKSAGPIFRDLGFRRWSEWS
jgi:5'-3' exonuclease